MIKATFGDRIDGWVRAAFPFLFTRRLNANLLSFIGVAICLAAAGAYASGSFVWGGVLLLAGGFFDLVDGVVARHQGTSTTFGAFLDSTLDRLVDMAALLGILMAYAAAGNQRVVVLTAVCLVTSVLTSYAKARAERFVPQFEGGVLERGERIGLLAAGGIVGWMEPALWVIGVGGVVTVFQRFALAYREMERLDAERVSSEPAPEGPAPLEKDSCEEGS